MFLRRDEREMYHTGRMNGTWFDWSKRGGFRTVEWVSELEINECSCKEDKLRIKAEVQVKGR